MDENSGVRNKVIVSVAGEDEFLDMAQYGLEFSNDEETVLNRIRPLIQEKYNVDIASPGGSWLYKTRKALANQNIHVIPNSTAGSEHALSYLDDAERLKAFEAITAGCTHLFSKGKLMDGKTCAACGNENADITVNSITKTCAKHATPDRLSPMLANFSALAERDPLFLAHFTSYAFKKLDSKDLKVMATFMSSLSDADGTPFVVGGEHKKPNWRIVAQAAFLELDPKLALRVLRLANEKRSFGARAEATHFSKHLRTAAVKYVRFREANPKALEGIKKAGLGRTFRSIYRIARIAPSPEAVMALRWKQKAGYATANVEIKASTTFNFEGMDDVAIAKHIRKEGLKPMGTIGALPDSVSPVVAAAILEQCSGDQAVILTSLFEKQGLLKNKEVKAVYEAKIRSAKSALDRVERVKAELDLSTKQALSNAKADVRKEQMGAIGKVFVHLDVSGSMESAIEIAKNKGSILAECVPNPSQNFFWGAFNVGGVMLKNPATFTKDAFMAVLYGMKPSGGTNCLSLFAKARELGCDTDIYITDGGQTAGDVASILRTYVNNGGRLPRQSVIIKCGHYDTALENGLRAVGIPVATIDQAQLSESALVVQALRTAIKGAPAILDDIMATPLLSLPTWFFSIGGAKDGATPARRSSSSKTKSNSHQRL